MSEAEVVSCASDYGRGGLGAHLQQAVAQARASGPVRYFCTAPQAGDPDGQRVDMRWAARRLLTPPVRWDPGRRSHLWGDIFDRAVARRLPPASAVRGFSGQALRTFTAARRGARLALECPTAHVLQVAERNGRACAAFPWERPWLGQAQIEKSLAEYARAGTLWVASRYAGDSFVAAGVPTARLRLRRLTVDLRRWSPPELPRPDGPLRVLFVGALSVTKGVPFLIEAFRHLRDPEAELVLCGGWGTRGMRRYLGEAMAGDPRLRLAHGDPLPHYRRANVYVHPSFQDGFGLAPLEAAACGLPLVLTRDTGAGEVLAGAGGGLLVPTGEVAPLVDVLRALAADPGRRARLGGAARHAAERWVAGEGGAVCASATTSMV